MATDLLYVYGYGDTAEDALNAAWGLADEKHILSEMVMEITHVRGEATAADDPKHLVTIWYQAPQGELFSRTPEKVTPARRVPRE